MNTLWEKVMELVGSNEMHDVIEDTQEYAVFEAFIYDLTEYLYDTALEEWEDIK